MLTAARPFHAGRDYTFLNFKCYVALPAVCISETASRSKSKMPQPFLVHGDVTYAIPW